MNTWQTLALRWLGPNERGTRAKAGMPIQRLCGYKKAVPLPLQGDGQLFVDQDLEFEAQVDVELACLPERESRWLAQRTGTGSPDGVVNLCGA
jgi:hypothetical protein